MALSLSSVSVKDGSDSWNSLLDLVYPVGALYISREPTSPATLFGGTWFRLSDVLLAAEGPNMGDVNAGGDTSPTGSFYIGVNNLPSHSHAVTIRSAGAHTHTINRSLMAYNADGHFAANGQYYTYRAATGITTTSNGAHTHTATCANVGNGERYMPYHANYYMWRRTA